MNKAPGIPARYNLKVIHSVQPPHEEIKNNRYEFSENNIDSQELQMLESSDVKYKVYTNAGLRSWRFG